MGVDLAPTRPSTPLHGPADLPGGDVLREVAAGFDGLPPDVTDAEALIRAKRLRLLLGQLARTWTLAPDVARADAADAAPAPDLPGRLQQLANAAERRLALFPRSAARAGRPRLGADAMTTHGDRRVLNPADDDLHPPRDGAPDWAETAWFAAVPERGIGIWAYPLFRTNLGVAAVAVHVWAPGGSELWQQPYCRQYWHLPLLEGLRLTDMSPPNGLTYRTLEPLTRTRCTTPTARRSVWT